MKTFNRDDVLVLLGRAVQLKGVDYIYKNSNDTCNIGFCDYVHKVGVELEPGCIVGTLLHLSGAITLERLQALGGGPIDVFIGSLHDENIHFTGDARRLLLQVQVHQDGRWPWGLAVKTAAERVGPGSNSASHEGIDYRKYTEYLTEQEKASAEQ